MYEAGSAYFNSIYNDDRSVKVVVTYLDNRDLLTGDDIISMEYESSMEGSNGLMIGGAISNKVTLKVYRDAYEENKANLAGGSFFNVGVKVNDSYIIPMGQYYVDSVNMEDGGFSVTLEMYDRMALNMGKPPRSYTLANHVGMIFQMVYDFMLDKPATLQDAFSSGAYVFYQNKESFPITSAKYSGDTRTLLGELACLCNGLNAVMDRESNKFNFVGNHSYSYEKYGIPADAIYQNGLKLTQVESVDGIEIKLNDDVSYSAGATSGNIIRLENRWITQTGTDIIWLLWNNRTMQNAEIHYRGNPAIDVGDTVTIADKDGVKHHILVTKHVIRVNGGMDGTIYCTFPSAENQESSSYSYSGGIEKRIPNISNEYDSTSEDGMSGIAVAQALESIAPTTTDLINGTSVSISNGTTVNTIASANISKGVYIVELSVLMSSVRSSTSGRAGFFFNTSTTTNNYHYAIQSITSGGNLRFHMSGVANVTANGTIYIRGFQNSGGAVSSNVYCRVTKIG